MTIKNRKLINFRAHLVESEMARSTVTRYMSAAAAFAVWLGDRPLTKDALIAWRDSLGRSAATVNVSIAAVNRLTAFLGHPELRLKHMRTQRQVFRSADRELTREEYLRLITTAERQGKERLARAAETICVLGIRVGELRAITVETLEQREATIRNKGKTRSVLLSSELVRKLRAYCRREGITSGPIFVTRTGKPLCRTQLWAELKMLCDAAGVDRSKVFPHNLRHLFAVTYYRLHKDIVRLADLLGHSNVNTTRIYLMTNGEEHRRELDRLGLMIPQPNI